MLGGINEIQSTRLLTMIVQTLFLNVCLRGALNNNLVNIDMRDGGFIQIIRIGALVGRLLIRYDGT